MAKLVDRFRNWRKFRQIGKGKAVLGRQDVAMKLRPSISVRVVRTDGTIEDLGTIWTGKEVNNGDSSN